MNPEISERPGAAAWTAWRNLPGTERRRFSRYACYLALLTLLFLQPLIGLASHAARYDLHSHVVLIPFITVYLLFIQRKRLPAPDRASIAGALLPSVLGFAAVAARFAWLNGLSPNDALALTTFAFVSFVAAGGFLFLGSRWIKAAAFPVAFLIFMVPLPDAAVDSLEKASMLASADAAALWFKLSGTPVLRERTVFALPGMVLQVAQECSGIRSSWVLFITSLLLSHVFLKTRWRKLVLVAFVIPLGILRNGFRVMVVGLLCVHIGPGMIDSPVHHEGGPLFFALSLIPLFLLLLWLRRQEKRLTLPG